MKPTTLWRVIYCTQKSTDLSVNLIKNYLQETCRILFDHIPGTMAYPIWYIKINHDNWYNFELCFPDLKREDFIGFNNCNIQCSPTLLYIKFLHLINMSVGSFIYKTKSQLSWSLHSMRKDGKITGKLIKICQ